MDCIIFGAGTEFLGDMLGVLYRLSWTPVGFVAGGEDGVPLPAGIDPVALDTIPDDWRALPAVIPVLTPSLRRSLQVEARQRGFSAFPAVVDPTSVVTYDSVVAEGAFINAGVVVGSASRIGPFAAVNRSVSVGHDNRIGDYAFLGPGATLCGNVTIGAGSVVGASAVLVPGVSVGTASIVAAGSAVYEPVADGTIVRGNPATVVKEGLTEGDIRV